MLWKHSIEQVWGSGASGGGGGCCLQVLVGGAVATFPVHVNPFTH